MNKKSINLIVQVSVVPCLRVGVHAQNIVVIVALILRQEQLGNVWPIESPWERLFNQSECSESQALLGSRQSRLLLHHYSLYHNKRKVAIFSQSVWDAFRVFKMKTLQKSIKIVIVYVEYVCQHLSELWLDIGSCRDGKYNQQMLLK